MVVFIQLCHHQTPPTDLQGFILKGPQPETEKLSTQSANSQYNCTVNMARVLCDFCMFSRYGYLQPICLNGLQIVLELEVVHTLLLKNLPHQTALYCGMMQSGASKRAVF